VFSFPLPTQTAKVIGNGVKLRASDGLLVPTCTYQTAIIMEQLTRGKMEAVTRKDIILPPKKDSREGTRLGGEASVHFGLQRGLSLRHIFAESYPGRGVCEQSSHIR
jgi:hypothetical protein